MGHDGRRLEFRVLGPFEVLAGGEPLSLGGHKPRALVALLLLRADEVVSTDRLIDELWADSPPPTAHASLQVYVSRLRKILEPARAKGGDGGVLLSKPSGYALTIDDHVFDLRDFERLVGDGRDELAAGRAPAAAALLEEALALWRGPALAEFAYESWAASEIGRLEELRVACTEDHIDAELACGRHGPLVSELETLVEANPLRERLRGQLMLALYRSGRQAEALEAFLEAREKLLEDLGIDPSPELQELHHAILNQDPRLTRSTPEAARHEWPVGGLPASRSPLIGRDRELTDLGALLAAGEVRLITLTGPGGIGKTRLALEAVDAAAAGFPDGVHWVPLATLRDDRLVLESVAHVLEATGGLASHVGDRRLLLLLDNFEQVIGAAPALADLLAECPNLVVVTTSREPLRLSVESEYPVPPLDEGDAILLFRERARGVGVELEPTPEIAEISRRLDHLPLAIELAAARARVLSPSALLGRLATRLPMLTGGARDLPERQRTLRSTIAWSHELLEADEQRVFAALSVFVGGWTLDAAEQVCEAELDTLQSLVEKSLVRHSGERFWMLETIREYADERLASAPTAEQYRRQHAEWALTLITRGNEEIQGLEAHAWLERLELEQDNLRAAFAWFHGVGETPALLELVSSSARFMTYRGSWSEGLRWANAALANAEGERDAPRARALRIAGNYADALGERQHGQAYEEEALSIFRELGDAKEISTTLLTLANNEANRGDLEAAERLLDDALVHARESGDDRLLAYVAGNRGSNALERGDFARSLELTDEALALFRALGHEVEVGWMLSNRAFCLLSHGRTEDALAAVRESSSVATNLNQRLFLVWSVILLAGVLSEQDDLATAACLSGTVDAECERTGLDLVGTEARVHARTSAHACDVLGDDEFGNAHSDGTRLSLEEGLELGLTICGAAQADAGR